MLEEEKERLITLESEFRSLKEMVEKLVDQTNKSFDKISEKLDSVILDSKEKPSFENCNERCAICEGKFGEIHGRINKVNENSLSKPVATLISVLCTIIGVLTTLLVVACK